ncbi:MAG: type II toxin-antitoxin system RelE/ParE family toxin [Aphanizomenon gracile PMC649.10]|nr:type II toxin-antitoxin system RelE/ParE family toxin [Aphanizomenon gracile PMC638.10]MDM3857790.1 type II toxin-antitoxin system RelE/ParE family toxin [Aphanizomenon gracile PMC649.10]MDM3860697.1 type II toxin-antitoxin system RelE/ParE family toxin [Aphanizomenon gracile PMC644.10]
MQVRQLETEQIKPLEWVGSSLEDLKEFPEEVKGEIGYALYLAQIGDKHPDTKPLKGFKGASVLEVVEDFDGDTYRAIYTVKLPKAVYVLHVFQKKSKHGIATPKQDIDLIEARLERAKQHYNQVYR